MIKCQKFYTAVSNMNKNILTVVDIFKGFSFLGTYLIFHIYYPVHLIVPMYCVLTIPRCSQGPQADFSAAFGKHWIHCNSVHEWKLLKNTLGRSFSMIRSEMSLNTLKQDICKLSRLMQPSTEHSLQPSNSRQPRVQYHQVWPETKILKCLHLVSNIPVQDDWMRKG